MILHHIVFFHITRIYIYMYICFFSTLHHNFECEISSVFMCLVGSVGSIYGKTSQEPSEFPPPNPLPRCQRFPCRRPSFLHVLNVSVVVEVSGQRCGELGRLAFLSSMGETEARKHILEMKGAKMMICNKTIRH